MTLDIKIYTTPSCPWCARTKQFLRELGVPFKEIDVSQDQKAAIYILVKTGQMGVPVTEINGEFVIGFDQARLLELIKKYENQS